AFKPGGSFGGVIANSGTVVTTNATSILLNAQTISTLVTNSGAINASGGNAVGITVVATTSYTGNVVNSGSIVASQTGARIGANFLSGAVTNAASGVISGSANAGFGLGGTALGTQASVFSGNVSNAGSITSGNFAIEVGAQTNTGTVANAATG